MRCNTWHTGPTVPQTDGVKRSPVRRLAPYVVGLLVIGGIALAIPKSWYSQDALDKSKGIGRYAGVLTPAQQASVNRLIPRLEAFVARDRGGAFPSGTSVRYLPDRRFKREVESGRLDSPEGISAAQIAVGNGLSARQSLSHLQHINVSDVVGLFLPPHQVLMRGNVLDIEHTDILAHELTHVWDATPLHGHDPRTRSGTPPDRYNAVDSLVEGDATAVQADYLDSIGPAEGCQVMEELAIPFTSACRALHYTNGLSRINPGDIDAATEAYVRFPYTVGASFIRALRAHGGERQVDRAFAHPPLDTAQIIEPSLYFHGVGPRRVAAPVVRHQRGRSASLGALGVSVTLTHGGFDLGSAGYLRGWAGDRYVESRRLGRGCLTDNLEMRSQSYATSAMRRFRVWSHQEPGRLAQRTGPSTLQFRTCR